MKLTRRFAVTALLCLGATLCTTTPARAQTESFPVSLSCVVGVDDPDYGASGEYFFVGMPTAWGVDPYGGGWTVYEGTLSLRCRDLTPRAVYSVGGKKSHADRDGNLEIQWLHVRMRYRTEGGWLGYSYWEFSPPPVYRLDTNKTSTLVLN